MWLFRTQEPSGGQDHEERDELEHDLEKQGKRVDVHLQLPCEVAADPDRGGPGARWRAFVIPRPIMSIVTNVARPVPPRAKVQRRSGRLRQAKPRTAEASAVMTRIVSGRKTVYSDRSEPSEDSLGPRRDHVED